MKEKLKYIIKVDGKVVWKGVKPTADIFDRIRKENMGKEVGIAIDPGSEILIA